MRRNQEAVVENYEILKNYTYIHKNGLSGTLPVELPIEGVETELEGTFRPIKHEDDSDGIAFVCGKKSEFPGRVYIVSPAHFSLGSVVTVRARHLMKTEANPQGMEN
jgi:hypothetical protein